MDNNENPKVNGNSPWWWLLAFFVGTVLSDLVFKYNPNIYEGIAPTYSEAKFGSVLASTFIVWVVIFFLIDAFNKPKKK